MPNWFINRIEIIGDEQTVEDVKAHIKGKDCVIDFNTIISEPDEIRNADALSREEWSICNWGVKKNAFSSDIKCSDNTITFETAGSEVFPIVSELQMMFNTCSFKYTYYEKDNIIN